MDLYAKKLGSLSHAYDTLFSAYFVNKLNESPLPEPLIKLVHTYDGRSFEAKSTMTFLEAATVNPPLEELKSKIVNLEKQKIPGFFNNTLREINAALRSGADASNCNCIIL